MERKINEIENLNNWNIEYFDSQIIYNNIVNEIKEKLTFELNQELINKILNNFNDTFESTIQENNNRLQHILEDKQKQIFEQTTKNVIEEKINLLKEEMEKKINKIENLNHWNIEYFNNKLIYKDFIDEITGKLTFKLNQELRNEIPNIFNDKLSPTIQNYNEKLKEKELKQKVNKKLSDIHEREMKNIKSFDKAKFDNEIKDFLTNICKDCSNQVTKNIHQYSSNKFRNLSQILEKENRISLSTNFISRNLRKIGDSAFKNCPLLTTVTIPNETEIGKDSFPTNCTIIKI